MFHLGYAYRFSGWGLRLDNVKSVEWLRKAAEIGNVHAIAEYACMLFCGIGVETNEELSNYWAQKSLSSNNPFAVGLCHYSGIGTSRDNEKAFLYFEKSAKEGDEFGQFHLGRCFDWGDGVKIEKAKALFWYLKSANQGLCRAQHLVAKSLPSSIKENKKKILWCQKAAKQGNEQCMKELSDLGIKY